MPQFTYGLKPGQNIWRVDEMPVSVHSDFFHVPQIVRFVAVVTVLVLFAIWHPEAFDMGFLIIRGTYRLFAML